jgi:hypothetical protein
MKNKIYHTFGIIVPKSNRKITERSKIDIPNTQIHDHESGVKHDKPNQLYALFHYCILRGRRGSDRIW